MNYLIYALHFPTPVHFGCAEEGGKLEQNHLAFEADRLFSALCCELASEKRVEQMETLYKDAATGQLLLSDLFPFFIDDSGEWCFYVPKPILITERKADKVVRVSYTSLQKDMTAHKKQKKLSYIRASQLQGYIKAMQTGDVFTWETPSWGKNGLVTRVNCTGELPLPYYVKEFTFSRRAGLYGILAYESDRKANAFISLLQTLGLTGIGGKRSSGYGKFTLDTDEIIYMDDKGVFHDDGALYQLLQNKGNMYMNLSVLFPQLHEVSTVAKGQYKLCKRSGFLLPDGNGIMLKKNSVFMVSSGSCFEVPLTGDIATVQSGGNHPVWRYGKGLFVGVTV